MSNNQIVYFMNPEKNFVLGQLGKFEKVDGVNFSLQENQEQKKYILQSSHKKFQSPLKKRLHYKNNYYIISHTSEGVYIYPVKDFLYFNLYQQEDEKLDEKIEETFQMMKTRRFKVQQKKEKDSDESEGELVNDENEGDIQQADEEIQQEYFDVHMETVKKEEENQKKMEDLTKVLENRNFNRFENEIERLLKSRRFR